MKKGRIFILLAIIIILALVAIWFFQNQMNKGGGGDVVTGQPGEVAPTPIPTTEVVVLAQNVSRGTVLTEEYLTTVPFPQESITPVMFTADQMSSVVGRRAQYDLEAGTYLNASMLVDLDETLPLGGSIAAISIPEGMVAIPIPVDRLSAVAYGLRPGDHVSVIGSFVMVDVDTEFQSRLPNVVGGVTSPGQASENGPSYLTVQVIGGGEGSVTGRTELDPLLNELVYVLPSEPQRARLVTQILMQDAMVLRFGEFTYDDLAPKKEETVAPPAEGEQPPQDQQTQDQNAPEQPAPEQKPPDIVTLIVTPQEAVALEYMMQRGVEFTLVLRANGDTTPIDTEAATFQYLMETYNIPVPSKLPYDLEPQLVPPADTGNEEGTNP
jgi:pilus assembly protein CpaB